MTVLRFPSTGEINPGPLPIHVCAPSHEDLLYATRKVGFGYSKKDARTRFYEGGLNYDIKTRVSNLETAPNWLKFWMTTQFLLHIENGQPLSPIEEDARERLGPDPYKYGSGPRKLKKPKW